MHRRRVKDALRAYAAAKKPTNAQLHALAAAFAEMIAIDSGEPVTITIRGIAIKRKPAAPTQ
jgi:hypothetical protein